MTRFDRFIPALAIWGIVCSIAALPSFLLASGEGFDQLGMCAGVAVYVVIYAATSSSEPFRRRWEADRAFSRTVVTGYALRLLLSGIVPVGMACDMLPGMIAVDAVASLGFTARTFAAAFLTTLVQGFLLNVILGMFMGVLYVVIKPFVRPLDHQPRGFMVIQPNAMPVVPPTPNPHERE